MVDRLYPDGSVSSDYKSSQKKHGDALRLSLTFETVFNRQALDDLILDIIPDNKYMPGTHHKLLLTLPWSDVFTTNYDTLLERTLSEIHNRKYDIVYTQSDIPRGMRPRIIKLHGSFPSHRPFILTEEDYRIYPSQFSGFVNTVQQAMMENIFCLIGFSGDDPNFLHWAGWVRDNLGKSMPPIYLCGVLDLTPAQRRVLENKNIIPVDLGPLFPEEKWPSNDTRHSKAIEWFLLTLRNGQPPNMVTWPSIQPRRKPESSPGIPEVPHFSQLDGFDSTTTFGPPFENFKFIELLRVWQKQREVHPGWVVLPEENRQALWDRTKDFVEPVIFNLDELDYPSDIMLVSELCWRLERCRVPLFSQWVDKIRAVVNRYNPYPNLLTIPEAEFLPTQLTNLNWDLISRSWVEAVFSLVRYAREDRIADDFCQWMGYLEHIISHDNEWTQRWFHEQTLYGLQGLDVKTTKDYLEKWPNNFSSPFWMVRKASILAELGETKETCRLAEEALTRIRTRIVTNVVDYELLSQEGWTMLLLQSLLTAKSSNSLNPQEELLGIQFRDRWVELEGHRCDPWSIIESSSRKVKGPAPNAKPSEEIKKAFDPGVVTKTFHSAFGLDINEIIPAFSFLRMYEDCGIPLSCAGVSIQRDEVFNASRWVMPFSPMWSINFMIRTGKFDETTEWFDRVRVATLDSIHVDTLVSQFYQALGFSMTTLAANLSNISLIHQDFNQLLVSLLPRLLSRLSFRIRVEQVAELYNLCVKLYLSPLYRRYHFFHKAVLELVQRVLYILPDALVDEKLVELLNLPIPGEKNFDVGMEQTWVEPFSFVDISGRQINVEREALEPAIKNLTVLVRSGTRETRGRAALRLQRLFSAGLLTAQEQEEFASALWGRVNETTGLPSETYFTDYAFLSLPESRHGIARRNFRKYLGISDFPNILSNGAGGVSVIGSSNYSFFYNWLYGTTSPIRTKKQNAGRFVPTPKEITALASKAIVWWEKSKNELTRDDPFDHLFGLNQEKQQYLTLFFQLIAEVILPNIGDNPEITKVIKEIVLEAKDEIYVALGAMPALLYCYSDLAQSIEKEIRRGIHSTNAQIVRASVVAVYRWCVYSEVKEFPHPPCEIISEIAIAVYSRRQPELEMVIDVVTNLITRVPHLFDGRQIDYLLSGLESLLSETLLPTEEERGTLNTFCRLIPIEELPALRSLAGKLANRLYRLYIMKNELIPPVLSTWEGVCNTDVLPEVRHAWVESE